MLDFAAALLLVGAVIALTEFVKRFLPAGTDARIVQGVAFGLAIALVFLVAETVWAHSQLIGEEPLDELDGASKLLAGLLLGAGANVGDRILKSVASVGENNDEPPR